MKKQRKRIGGELSSLVGKLETLLEKYGEGSWIRIYEEARKHLPDGYYDEVWAAFIKERVESLRRTTGDEFIIWLLRDEYLSGDYQGRDYRSPIRESRYTR